MRRVVTIFAFLIAPALVQAQGLPAGTSSELGFDAKKLDAITERLTRAIDNKELAGASALIARNGHVAYLTAVGNADREANKVMTTDTIVRIASMTKPVTSVAVMMLVDEGKIALDDPVSKYLPEFKDMKVVANAEAAANDPAKVELVDVDRPITIRHLLTHTSGLSYRFINAPVVGPMYVESALSDGLSETPGTQRQNIKRLARLPLLFQPGTRWHYGLNIDVLGCVVEIVSGKSLDQFFRERIFTPLTMEDSYFVLPAEKRERLAAVYGVVDGKPLARRSSSLIQMGPLVYDTTYSVWDDNAGFYAGGAGLVSTLGDYARFCQMMLNRGELDGVRLLKPETVDAMASNQLGDAIPNIGMPGTGFGYGFGVTMAGGTGPQPVGTYAWGGFFSTTFWIDPKNQLVGLVFTQTHPAGATTLSADFQRMTYEALAK